MRVGIILVLAVLVAAAGTVRSTGARYVASTLNPGASFATAGSFNTVASTLADPGTPIAGTRSLSATATSNYGIASVAFQRSPAGAGTWTAICTATSSPYTCSWATSGVTDGSYDLRAVATDTRGYTATSTVAARVVDNTAPTVTLTDPGTPLTGTVNVSAGATDAGSGPASVSIAYRATGNTAWTPICTQTGGAATCAWNTAQLADGSYELQATALDAAGNTGTSATVTSRRVDNNAPTVTMTDPGAYLRGTSVTLSSTTGDGAGTGVSSVAYKYRTSPSGAWLAACTGSVSPFSCSFTLPADGTYDFQAIATDGVNKTTTSATVSSRQVDNTAPATATITNPGTPKRGTVTLTGSGTDNSGGSGIGSLTFQIVTNAGTNWTALPSACVATAPATTCSWATTGVTDGSYQLRTLATDKAGNTLASTATTAIVVDNTAPTATLTDPGTTLRRSQPLAGTASDTGSGVSGVVYEYQVTGGGWTAPSTACTGALGTAPNYSCTWDTSALSTTSSYDVREKVTDAAGNITYSTAVTNRPLDNVAPTGSDIQGANGGVAKTLDSGDSVTWTWSESVSAASVLTGWNGSSSVVTVNVSSTNVLTITSASGTVNLGTVTLNNAWSSGNVTATGSMVMTGSTVKVTLTAAPTPSNKMATGVATTTAMSWATSTAVTDLAGNPVTSATVTESGTADVDF